MIVKSTAGQPTVRVREPDPVKAAPYYYAAAVQARTQIHAFLTAVGLADQEPTGSSMPTDSSAR
ncbi:hypothetical protein [Streptomyces sp. NPDC055506]